MGAWGVNPFDNDDAADWASEFAGLDAEGGLRLLKDAMSIPVTGYLDSDAGAVAVAAAHVVAWVRDPSLLNASPYSEVPAAWIRDARPTAASALAEAARQALRRVRSDDSELADLWAESGDDEWQRTLNEIDHALSGGS